MPSLRSLPSLASLMVLGPVAASLVVPAPATAQDPWMTIDRTRTGYHVVGGLQGNRITVTRTARGLRIADPATAVFRGGLSRACDRIHVRKGVAAVCAYPRSAGPRHPLRLEIVTRLGDDLIDTSALGRGTRAVVLADWGNDTVRLGAGNDFVNGAKGVDHVSGGAGDDWIRTGLGDDVIRGGAGADRLVGVDGADRISGGDGRDSTEGGPGRDQLSGGAGVDRVLCGDGRDTARVERRDSARRDCERMSFR